MVYTFIAGGNRVECQTLFQVLDYAEQFYDEEVKYGRRNRVVGRETVQSLSGTTVHFDDGKVQRTFKLWDRGHDHLQSRSGKTYSPQTRFVLEPV